MKLTSLIILITVSLATTAIAFEDGKYPQFLTGDIEALRKGENSTEENTEALPKWLALFEKGNLWEKQVALDGLGFLEYSEYRKDTSVFDPILKGLKDKDPAVRAATAAYFKYLGEYSNGCCKETNIIPSLIEVLQDENPETRREAAKALACFKDSRAVEPLLKRLQDKDPWVRLEAVFALGEIRDQKTILPLLDLLYDDSDFRNKFVQQECLIAIRKIASPTKVYSRVRSSDGSNKETGFVEKDLKELRSRMVPILINRFNDPYLKAEIIKTFAKYGIEYAPTKTLQTKIDDSSIALLIASLKDPSPDIRESSVVALGASEDERTIDPLIEALHDSDRDVQIKAINALGKFKQERILDELVPFLGSSSLGNTARSTFLSIAKKTAQGHVYYFKKEGDLWVAQNRIDVKGAVQSEHTVHPHAVEILIQELDKVDTKSATDFINLTWNFHCEDIAPHLIRFLNAPSPVIRELAITKLYGFSGRKALPYIINALNDTDSAVRKIAVEMLGDFPAEQALEPLLKRLYDPEVNVRKAAVKALGKIKDIKSIDPLIKMLSDDDYNVRIAALESLGEFNEPRIYDQNIKMLEDKSPNIRREAVKNIKKRPDKRAVDPLILLLNDTDSLVRSLAAEALGEIGDERAVEALINVLNSELNRGQGGRESNFSRKIILALAKLGDKSAVPYLTKALDYNDLKGEAKQALKSLGVQSEEEKSKEERRPVLHKGDLETTVIKIPQGVKGQDSSSSQVSEKAELPAGFPSNMRYSSRELVERKVKAEAEAKAKAKEEAKAKAGETELPAGSGGAEPAQNLISSLKDQDKNVRQDAARKLGKRKAKDAAGAIIDGLNDPDIDVRVALIWALGEINDPVAVKPLASLLKDSNRRIRTSSFNALGKIEGPAAKDALINALAQRNDYLVRLEAADTLGDIGAKEAVSNLIALLDDKNEYLRQAAVRALGGPKEKDAVEPLLKRLYDQDLHVKVWAIQSLKKINDTRAVEPLLALALSEKDKEIRSLSIEALKGFKDPNAKEIMKRIFFEEYDSDIYIDRKKAEMILSIIGEKSTLRALQDPDGDDQKTVSNYIRLMMTPPSSPFIELGKKALKDFKDRELVVAEISNLIKANKIKPKIENREYVDKIDDAVSFLRSLKDPLCIPTFIHVLENRKDYKSGPIRSACGALGDLNYSESAPLLMEIVVNPVEQSYVRMDTARALGKIGAREAVPSLIDIIKNGSEDKDLRVASAATLGEIKDNRAVEPLINILKDPDEDRWLRVASAEALGNIGDQTAVGPLEEAIKDSNLKQASQNALKKLQLKD